MDLTLCGSRADGSPAYEIREVLRRNHVEELGAGRHSHLCQIEEEATCNAQSVTDAERFIEVWIVNQPFPTQSSPRFLEVNAHHDQEVAGKLCDRVFEQSRILSGGNRIVDGAGANNDDEAIVRSIEDVYDLATRVENCARGVIGDRHLLLKEDWRENNSSGFDPEVICGICHGCSIRILGMRSPGSSRERWDAGRGCCRFLYLK